MMCLQKENAKGAKGYLGWSEWTLEDFSKKLNFVNKCWDPHKDIDFWCDIFEWAGIYFWQEITKWLEG
jgi:hypothetical protein